MDLDSGVDPERCHIHCGTEDSKELWHPSTCSKRCEIHLAVQNSGSMAVYMEFDDCTQLWNRQILASHESVAVRTKRYIGFDSEKLKKGFRIEYEIRF